MTQKDFEFVRDSLIMNVNRIYSELINTHNTLATINAKEAQKKEQTKTKKEKSE